MHNKKLIKEAIRTNDFFIDLEKAKPTMSETSQLIKKQKEQNRISKLKQIIFRRKPVIGISDIEIRKLYIYLFHELFISGKYDSLFRNDSIDVSTSELFKF